MRWRSAVRPARAAVVPARALASRRADGGRVECRRDWDVTGRPVPGGIRSAKLALHYLVMVKETLGDAWLTPGLFRFGASALLNDLLRQLLKEATGRYMAMSDFAEA